MSERLEEIKEEYTPIDNGLINLYFIEEKDYKWLIQQAERAEQAEHANSIQQKQLNEAWQINNRYKQALDEIKLHAQQCEEIGRNVLPYEVIGRVNRALEVTK